MDNTIWNEINTTLDLNGPILSFSEQPTGATGIGTTAGATGGGSVSFTGIATGVSAGTGYISYQWYEVDVGKLSDDTYIAGTSSTAVVGSGVTLTLSNLVTPRDNQRKFYVVADYVPSAYQQDQLGIAKSTGNAWNEPLTSGIGTVTVTPLIEIVAQPPQGIQRYVNNNATISVNADLTDGYFTDDLQYQWYLNGELAVNGVKTVTTVTGSVTAGTVENTYTSAATHQLPAVGISNLEITLAGGAGGNGGRDGGGPGGSGGQSRVGRFSLPDSLKGSLLDFKIGLRGNGGPSGNSNAGGSGGGGVSGALGGGGQGGGAGNRGWAGGGGGGGGATYVGSPYGRLISAAGGGGGGGGSHNRGGENADGPHLDPSYPAPKSVGEFIAISSQVPVDSGNNGESRGGNDGGGGGGGGGGHKERWVSGFGGGAGLDKRYGGMAGDGGGSRYISTYSTLISQWKAGGDGYANIKYTGYTDTTITTVKKTTLSGTTSNTLTISADHVGVQTCQCKITSATGSNSPIWTDVTNFVTTDIASEYLIKIESIGVGQTATLSTINLNNGDYEFATTQSQVSSGQITNFYSLYSPDKDINIEMDLYGGKGDDQGSYTGGEGGYSRIRFTMVQNTEYIITGLSTALNSPFVYRKAELIACVGQGGGAGISGNGGNGGGVTNEGQDGRGRESGVGGVAIAEGTLGSNGIFGSKFPAQNPYLGDTQEVTPSQKGGRTIRCTKGNYWAQQGIAACNDMSGTNVFRLSDGTSTDTALITRGFKAGYNIMETAGAKDANGGLGGNGATGGSGGSAGGGGGGSGYNDGSITVVDTQQGGSTANAKVILRVVT